MNADWVKTRTGDICFRTGFILESLAKGVPFGSKEFLLYHQLRWYETDGKHGFCFAGYDRLAKDVGLTEAEVKDALCRLRGAGLVEHIWCDKKAYRNKTKIWMSIVRLSGVCTNIDAIKVLKKGKRNTDVLPKTTCGHVETVCGDVETTCGHVAHTPVVTGNGNNKLNNKINKKLNKKDLYEMNLQFISSTIQDSQLKELWLDFIKMRYEVKHAVYKTETTISRAVKWLERASQGDIRYQKALLIEATDCEWLRPVVSDWRKKEDTMRYLDDYIPNEANPSNKTNYNPITHNEDKGVDNRSDYQKLRDDEMIAQGQPPFYMPNWLRIKLKVPGYEKLL